MNQYIKQYQKAYIETASREQILLILYDGAIQFLNKAKIAIQNKEIENAHNNIMSAEKIIQEFINSLDRDASPELADNLTGLYEYFIRRLVHANLKKDIGAIDEVLKYLKTLRATWAKAIAIYQKENGKKENSGLDNYETTTDSDSDDEDAEDLD